MKTTVERLNNMINDVHKIGVDGVAWRADAISKIPDLVNWDKVSNAELNELLDAMDEVLDLRTKLFGRF